MSLEKRQFFSPEIESFRDTVRASPEAAPWIKFADEISDFGTEIVYDINIPVEGAGFVAAGLFGRTHESMQAGVTLIERGMIGDGRAVLRGATENAIALNALANDQNFTKDLVSASNADALKWANVILDNAALRAEISPTEVARVEAERTRLKALPDDERRAINWWNVANKHCPDLYNTLYRLLSSDGTHVTMNALARRFEVDNGVVKQMKFGPDTEGLVSSLRAACAVFLHAIEPFIRLYQNPAWEPQLRAMTQRLANTPLNELPW